MKKGRLSSTLAKNAREAMEGGTIATQDNAAAVDTAARSTRKNEVNKTAAQVSEVAADVAEDVGAVVTRVSEVIELPSRHVNTTVAARAIAVKANGACPIAVAAAGIGAIATENATTDRQNGATSSVD